MKSVMIVDDERPARELLKMAIDWKSAGYEIIAEAKDGKDALEKNRQLQPDVVITDIQMPVMDGIEFIEEARKENKHQRIVILSCHESFQYAKKAMKLGIDDYLIKDSYSPSELYLLLEQIRGDETSDLGGEISTKESIDSIKEKEDMIRAALDGEDASIELLKTVLGTKKNQFFACIIPLKELQKRMGTIPEQIVNEIKSCIEQVPDCFSFMSGPNHLVVVSFFVGNYSMLENINLRHKILQEIRNKLEEEIDFILTVACSKIHHNMKHLLVAVEEAEKALKYVVFTGNRRVVYFEAIPDTNKILEVDTLNRYISKVQEGFEKNDEDEIGKYLERIYGQDMQGMAQCNYLEYANSIFFGYMNQQISNRKLNQEKLWGGSMLSFSELNNLETVGEMQQWIYNKLCSILNASQNQDAYSEYVSKSIEYIEKSYQQDIKVDQIADSIGIHKAYLSRIFKKETGISLNTYLNEYRIKKAIRLMNENELKMSDIIYSVGYNNSQNFYYAFKQVTGVTPKEYMKK